ncbi:hypothetical protein BRADI_4g29933v3, partial [Brachypodium distachyon]
SFVSEQQPKKAFFFPLSAPPRESPSACVPSHSLPPTLSLSLSLNIAGCEAPVLTHHLLSVPSELRSHPTAGSPSRAPAYFFCGDLKLQSLLESSHRGFHQFFLRISAAMNVHIIFEQGLLVMYLGSQVDHVTSTQE